MDPSFLLTKLYIPPVPPEIVSRSRLVERLTAGLHRKVTVISAPAGFGKTTLLSEWIHDDPDGTTMIRPNFAWLSLDKNDNDPTRFWTYFIAALQTIRPDIGKRCFNLIQAPNRLPFESMLTTLINDIDKEMEDCVFILDDYHLIETRTIHQAMDFLIDHLPPQFHLVIAGRADPPLALARLRGRGHLNELRTTDLRFTSEEIATFFNQVMILGLTEENIKVLENRTEGWIASLQMAGASMQGRDDIPGFIQDFSGTHHYIMDYLTQEILQRQQQHVQSFLLKTSILERVSGPLANAITKGNDGQEQLEQLASANLFLVPLDDNREWFRYHQLFADLLHNQLLKSEPHLLLYLHQRASEWFEHEGMMTEAVHHALAIDDFERAADLIESIAVPMIGESKLSAPRQWLAKLPGKLITSRPWLSVSLASVHLAAGEFDAAEQLLQSAESLVIDREKNKQFRISEEYNRIRNQMVALRATLAIVQGDISRTFELCNDGLKHLPDDQPTARCLLTFDLGAAYWMSGELSTATYYLDEAIALSESTGNFFIALVCIGYTADIQVKKGQLRQAAETNRQAFELGIKWGSGEPLPATSYVYISQAQVLYQWNEIAEAKRHLAQGIDLLKDGVESTIAMMAYPGLALLNELQETGTVVMEALDQEKRFISASQNMIISNTVDAWMTRLALAEGDFPAAERWVANLNNPELQLHNVPDAWLEFAYLTLIRVYIAQGQVTEIPDALENLLQRAESEERMGSVIEILILQSIALQAQGKINKALDKLKSALSLAEPEGYIRIFVDEGNPMQELLEIALSRNTALKYVKKLLDVFNAEEQLPQTSQTEIASKPLTIRELEVLRLMADGASSQQIADDLFLSIGTVKKHIENIYSKLGVHKRTLAVTRAQQLDLL